MIEGATHKRITLRGRQPEWIEKVEADLATGFTRMLFAASGGVGKSTVMGELAYRAWTMRGERTLITVNRQSIVRQTAKRIADEQGLEVSIEMGDETASPYAPVVVASVLSYSKTPRLTGFADNHFAYVFPDECHLNTLSAGALKILNYHHYGAESLQENWTRPPDGFYTPKAKVIGYTATPEPRLLDWYQHTTVKYPYFQAVVDGVLVPVIQKSIPVKIDLRRAKVGTSSHGRDFSDADTASAIAPVIEELADQVVMHASDRKPICFTPSIDTARSLSDALCRRGMKGVYVSGECDDGDEKTRFYRDGGKGYVLVNAQIYNFGVDFPDCDAIGWFRPTISKSFYLQGVFRASRVLPGVIDGIEDAEMRRAAIAASDKKNFLILDPFYNHERHDLADAYDLFTENEEVKQRMKADGILTPEAAEKAERDFVKALNKAARKVKDREARIIDPLSWGVSLGIERLKDYQPETDAEAREVTPEQINFLQKQHIAIDGIKCRGAASLVIGTFLKRMSLKLATPEQLNFLRSLGMEVSPTLSRADATRAISARLGR